MKKYQVHICWPNRCFRTSSGKVTPKCKYGFPFPERESDGVANDGIHFKYRRTHPEDTNVVPYNPYALLMWDAHVCTMRITSCGLDRYLIKYIAKEEPTFGLYIINYNEVQQYLETRALVHQKLLLYSHLMQSADVTQVWYSLTLICQMTRSES